VAESHALAREPIEVRRQDLRMPLAAEAGCEVLVGRNKQHVHGASSLRVEDTNVSAPPADGCGTAL
jgi:hypothetical protein